VRWNQDEGTFESGVMVLQDPERKGKTPPATAEINWHLEPGRNCRKTRIVTAVSESPVLTGDIILEIYGDLRR